MIALHAERVAGEPAAVRWVVPPGGLPSGRIRTAPGGLGALFADGTLTGGLVEHGAVWLWLRDGLSWREQGRTVEAALRDALVEPADWVIEPAPAEVLMRVMTDLIDGSVGDFVRSHGGTMTAEPAGEQVAVQLGGACAGCTAAEQTLRQRLLGELRQRCPGLVEVDSRGDRLVVGLTPATGSSAH